jgi:hypothetical protein
MNVLEPEVIVNDPVPKDTDAEILPVAIKFPPPPLPPFKAYDAVKAYDALVAYEEVPVKFPINDPENEPVNEPDVGIGPIGPCGPGVATVTTLVTG